MTSATSGFRSLETDRIAEFELLGLEEKPEIDLPWFECHRGYSMSPEAQQEMSSEFGSEDLPEIETSDYAVRGIRGPLKEIVPKRIQQKENTNIKYLVSIETGLRPDMGTSAEAHLILKAGDKSSEQLKLNHLGGSFVPGSKQEFEVTHRDMGELTAIEVGHAGGQHDAGWFVKNISITDPVSQTQYTFVCNRWLASDRGDGKTAVEFTPSYRNVLGTTLSKVPDNAASYPITKFSPPLKFKTDDEIKLDMQQNSALDRILSLSAIEKQRRESDRGPYNKRSITNVSNLLYKLNLFKQKSVAAAAEVVNSPLPPKKGQAKYKNVQPTKNLNRRVLRQKKKESTVAGINLRDVHRMNHQGLARDIEFFCPAEEPKFAKPVYPAVAQQFIEQSKLVHTETGELAYELDEEESKLLMNCGNHNFLRRSQTEHNVLSKYNLLNNTDKTEFGSVVRRSDTICLPMSGQIMDEGAAEFNDYLNYRKICLLEKPSAKAVLPANKTFISSTEDVGKAPKSECVFPTPPRTPTPSSDEESTPEEDRTPMQYLFLNHIQPPVVAPVLPPVVAATEEETHIPVTRQFTQPFTPPAAVSPISEEREATDTEDETSETKDDEESIVTVNRKSARLRNTPSVLSNLRFSQVDGSSSSGSPLPSIGDSLKPRVLSPQSGKLSAQSIRGSVKVEEIFLPKSEVVPECIPKAAIIVDIKSRESSPISVSAPSKEEQISYTPDSTASESCLPNITVESLMSEKLPVQSIGGSVQVEEINPPKNGVSPSRIPKPLVNRTYIVGIKSREYSPISVSVPSKEEQISYTRTPDSIASGSCLSDSTAESLMSGAQRKLSCCSGQEEINVIFKNDLQNDAETNIKPGISSQRIPQSDHYIHNDNARSVLNNQGSSSPKDELITSYQSSSNKLEDVLGFEKDTMPLVLPLKSPEYSPISYLWNDSKEPNSASQRFLSIMNKLPAQDSEYKMSISSMSKWSSAGLATPDEGWSLDEIPSETLVIDQDTTQNLPIITYTPCHEKESSSSVKLDVADTAPSVEPASSARSASSATASSARHGENSESPAESMKSKQMPIVANDVEFIVKEKKEDNPVTPFLASSDQRHHQKASMKEHGESRKSINFIHERFYSKILGHYMRRRRVKKMELDPNSPYIKYELDRDAAILGVINDVEASEDISRTQEHVSYRKKQQQMLQKRGPEDLNELDVKRSDIVHKVYRGGRVDPNNRIYSPVESSSSESAATTSVDEDDELDPVKDKGLATVLRKINSLTNANVGELKSYKTPPSEVISRSASLDGSKLSRQGSCQSIQETIAEIKSYDMPPVEIRDVVKCVFMILGENLKKLESWQECVKQLSKLGQRHVRNRVLRMRKSRVTPEMRDKTARILSGWTSFDIARRSKVCVVFFIWCKEICDLNLTPADNPLMPTVQIARFNQSRLANSTARVERYNKSTSVNAFHRARITGNRSVLPPLRTDQNTPA